MAKPRTRLPTIAGSIPHPFNRPVGCAFSPRCTEIIAGVCDASQPPQTEDGIRRVRCFLHGDAA
jgi:ABC-type dipeptide/oligopeptide/nickel transport system ATPase component